MNNQGRLILHVCFLITLFLTLPSFLFLLQGARTSWPQCSACTHSTVASVKVPVSLVASAEKAIILTASNDNLVDYTSQGLLLIMQKCSFLPYKYVFIL